MKKQLTAILFLAAAAGCSQGPPAEVAKAYAGQYGAAKTSLFTPCPEINGVWNLREPTAGTRMDTDGRWLKDYPVPHFRWVGPSLFGLTPSLGGVIASGPHPTGTMVFFADKPYTEANPARRGTFSYATRSDKEFPCVGAGWRRSTLHDHSLNDAAARVLDLDARRPRQIRQTDHMAITPAGELLIGVQVQYSGTTEKGAAVSDAYWHFLKLPRLAKDAKAAGFVN